MTATADMYPSSSLRMFASNASLGRQTPEECGLTARHNFGAAVLSALRPEGRNNNGSGAVNNTEPIEAGDYRPAEEIRLYEGDSAGLLAASSPDCLLACHITYLSASLSQIRKYDISLCGRDESGSQ